MPQPTPRPEDAAPLCAPDCPGDPAALARVRQELPDDEVLYDLAELSRAPLSPQQMTAFLSRSMRLCELAAGND